MAIEVPDWYRTVALVGVDITGEPVVVLLDSTGAIMAVMKGEYAGTLKNIAVDAAGRVIMIPTDPADVWGNAISMGSAELAAVFSPAKRFDRRGQVIFIDNFEEGLAKWGTGGVGTGYSVGLSSDEANFGAFSAKLTGGSTSLAYARIYRRLPKPPLSNLGLEFSFIMDANVTYVRFYIDYFDGTAMHVGDIRYDTANEKWQYLTTGNVWTDFFTDARIRVVGKLFHSCKLVMDPVNGKYVRALVAGEEKDMSAYDLYTSTDSTAPCLSISINIYSDLGTNAVGYVDSVIITQNEPA